MKTTRIYKYVIQPVDLLEIEMPQDSKILCVQIQKEVPCIWVEVNLSSPLIKRRFSVYGTGHEMPNYDNEKYIGTFQMYGGSLVFHLYEIAVKI